MRDSIIFHRLFLLVLLVLGCQPKILTENELKAFVSDESNGLSMQKQVGEVSLRLVYRPTELLVAHEIRGTVPTDSVIEAVHRKYQDYSYFVLSLSRHGEEALYRQAGSDQFSESLQNMAFRMDQFTNLTNSDNDTIPLADAVLPRTYGIGSATQMMLVFANQKLQESDWFQLNLTDPGFGIGRQSFRIKTENIKNIPVMRYD